MTETEDYTDVCVLRHCGQLDGNEECCEKIKDQNLHNIVLKQIWQQIGKEHCAQYAYGRCLSHGNCLLGQSFCYPIVSAKRPNLGVIVEFARYCAEETKKYADRRILLKNKQKTNKLTFLNIPK